MDHNKVKLPWSHRTLLRSRFRIWTRPSGQAGLYGWIWILPWRVT